MNDYELKPKEITAKIQTQLKNKYCDDGWVILFEVANSTGTVSNYADAIVMGVWPSRNYELHGFEIKSIRSDWLKELNSPSKAESIAKYMDFWWIVAPPKVVQENELPEKWGLMISLTDKLTTKIRPSKLNPTEVDRGLLASMLRNAKKNNYNEEILKNYWNLGYCEGKKFEANQNLKNQLYFDTLTKNVEEFYNITGIDINHRNLDTEKANQFRDFMNNTKKINNFKKWDLSRLYEASKKVIEIIEELEKV